jgi:hypothetical protein
MKVIVGEDNGGEWKVIVCVKWRVYHWAESKTQITVEETIRLIPHVFRHVKPLTLGCLVSGW